MFATLIVGLLIAGLLAIPANEEVALNEDSSTPDESTPESEQGQDSDDESEVETETPEGGQDQQDELPKTVPYDRLAEVILQKNQLEGQIVQLKELAQRDPQAFVSLLSGQQEQQVDPVESVFNSYGVSKYDFDPEELDTPLGKLLVGLAGKVHEQGQVIAGTLNERILTAQEQDMQSLHTEWGDFDENKVIETYNKYGTIKYPEAFWITYGKDIATGAFKKGENKGKADVTKNIGIKKTLMQPEVITGSVPTEKKYTTIADAVGAAWEKLSS